MDGLKREFEAIGHQIRYAIDEIIHPQFKDVRKRSRLDEINNYLYMFKEWLTKRFYAPIAGFIRKF